MKISRGLIAAGFALLASLAMARHAVADDGYKIVKKEKVGAAAVSIGRGRKN